MGVEVLLWMWKAEVPQMGSKLVVMRTAKDCTHLQLSESGTKKLTFNAYCCSSLISITHKDIVHVQNVYYTQFNAGLCPSTPTCIHLYSILNSNASLTRLVMPLFIITVHTTSVA